MTIVPLFGGKMFTLDSSVIRFYLEKIARDIFQLPNSKLLKRQKSSLYYFGHEDKPIFLVEINSPTQSSATIIITITDFKYIEQAKEIVPLLLSDMHPAKADIRISTATPAR